MAYQLKGGEEIRDGKLFGWTGNLCGACGGYGEQHNCENGPVRCDACAGTGEEWGFMPAQPTDLDNPQ